MYKPSRLSDAVGQLLVSLLLELLHLLFLALELCDVLVDPLKVFVDLISFFSLGLNSMFKAQIRMLEFAIGLS